MGKIRGKYGERVLAFLGLIAYNPRGCWLLMVGAAGFEPTTTTPPVMWLKRPNLLKSLINTLFLGPQEHQKSPNYTVDFKGFFLYSGKLFRVRATLPVYTVQKPKHLISNHNHTLAPISDFGGFLVLSYKGVMS